MSVLAKKLQAPSAATPSGNNPPFQNVALLLHGDGTNGAQNNTFVDSSSNNFTITRTGNLAQGTFSPFSLPEGQWSNYFDGSGDFLSTPDNNAFDFSTSDFTIECWFNISGPSALNSASTRDANLIACLPTSGAGNNAYSLGINGNSTVTGTGIVFANFQSGIVYTVSSSETINYGSWNHIAVSRSGTVTKLFLNGVERASGTLGNQTVNCAYDMRIGSSAYTGYLNQFNGYISNVRIVKGTALYTSNFAPPTTPLTAITNTSLLTCQSNRFKDNSSNNFTITRVGNTRVTAFSPFAPSAAYSASTNGGSGYFDGSGDYLTMPYPNTSLEIESGDFTVEAWIYIPSSTNYKCIFGNWIDTAGGVLFCLYNGGSALLWRPFSVDIPLVTGPAVQLNAWNHVAVSRSGNVFTVFTNGVAGTSVTYSTNIGTTAVYRVGVYSNGSGGPWLGYMTDVRVIKGTALYTANFTPPTAPLTAVANTQLLLNFTNAGIIDNAGKNDIETVGNAQVSTSVKKYGTGSMYFDGTGDYLTFVSNPNLEFGSGNYTIEMWVQTTNSSLQALATKNSSGANTNWSWLLTSNAATSGDVHFYIQSFNNTNPLLATSGVAINDGAWHHIAVVRNGSSHAIYVDGVSRATATSSFTQAVTTWPLNVGVDQTFGPRNFNGYIDDLRITRGQALYTSNFTPPTQAFPDV